MKEYTLSYNKIRNMIKLKEYTLSYNKIPNMM